MMRSNFKITRPEIVDFTLTITMSLEDWMALKGQFNTAAHPAGKLKDAIYDMVQQADKFFIPKKETKEH